MAGQPLNLPTNPPVDDARWFADEVRPHEEDVRGYLRHRFPELETDDIIQESYLLLWRIRAKGRIRSIRQYFFGLARNTAIAVFRKGRHRSPVTVNELPEACLIEEGTDALHLTQAHERLELLAQALETLPGRCREIVELAVVQGQSSSAIATRLNLSESTVRVQLARGVHRCTAYLKKKGMIP